MKELTIIHKTKFKDLYIQKPRCQSTWHKLHLIIQIKPCTVHYALGKRVWISPKGTFQRRHWKKNKTGEYE